MGNAAMTETTKPEACADAGGQVERSVSCGYCMNCKYFKPIEYRHMGDCTNEVNFSIGYAEPDAQVCISGAVIEGDEGWGWHVGRNFGCIHFAEAGS